MQDKYDFIIVGLGAAGCVVAARLAEKGYSILCIEAGSDYTNNKYVTTPFSELLLWGNPNYAPPYDNNYDEWLFKTKPQNNKEYIIPRGVELGGSASHNAMITLRGDKCSYDKWAFLTGDASWNYNNMLKYFIKLENNNIEGTENKWHGKLGWFKISQPPPELVQLDLMASALDAGLPYVKDFNGDPDKIAGVGLFNAAINNGERSNSAINLFLPVYKISNNIKINYNSLVTKLIIKDKKIIGVKYQTGKFSYKADTQYKNNKRSNTEKTAYVNNEVILCAGAINTPQILMLSGIGPAKHLAEHNIKLEHELNGVGSNLQDHIDVTLIHEIKIPYSYNTLGNDTCQKIYDAGKIGPYASNGCAMGYDWFANDRNRINNPSCPDYHVSSFITYFENFDLESWIGNVDKNKYYHTTLIELTHPTARGTIKLKNSDPYEIPEIDENLINDIDIESVAQGFMFSRKLWSSDKMKKYEPIQVYPTKGETENLKDIKKFIASNCAYGHHLSGTTKMGNIGDKNAVVDSKLKVIGLSGLRIVDASIFPTITSVNPTLPIYAVAEKAASMIDSEYSKNDIPIIHS